MASHDDASVAANAANVRRGSVIAAAGCGKTEQISRATNISPGRRLILTHTHAGVDALKGRLQTNGVPQDKFSVDTIAAWSLRFAASYPLRSGLTITEPTDDDWDAVYRCATTLIQSGALAGVLDASYHGLFVDEYQDCTTNQHPIICALSDYLPTCIFGDPLQAIFDFRGQTPVDWKADVFPQFPLAGELLKPWRWHNAGSHDFADWLQEVRHQLEARQPIDLTDSPGCVNWLQLPPAGTTPQERGKRQRAVLAACQSATADEGETIVVIGDGANLAARTNLAQKLAKRGYSNIEPVGCPDLTTHAANIHSAEGQARLEALVDFAVDCMTGLERSQLLQGVRSHLDGGRQGATRFGDVIPLCLQFADTASFNTAANLLDAFRTRPDNRVFRREMLYAMRSALQLMTTGQYETLADAVWEVQNRVRHAGRRIGYRNIGSTLLIKGLEFDHAIIADADRLTRKNLYVAITRPSRSLTIMSSSEQLNPAD